MEINNNMTTGKTSFGMALKTPSAKEITNFAKYIKRGRDVKFVNRGLKQIEKEQRNNKYFDITYINKNGVDGFELSPKANIGIDMQPKYYMDNSVVYPRKFDKHMAEMENEVENMSDISTLKQIKFMAKAVVKTAKNILYTYMNPKEILPATLRKASDDATSLAKNLEEQEKMNKNIMDSLS